MSRRASQPGWQGRQQRVGNKWLQVLESGGFGASPNSSNSGWMILDKLLNLLDKLPSFSFLSLRVAECKEKNSLKIIECKAFSKE